jgi:hypothetical protein
MKKSNQFMNENEKTINEIVTKMAVYFEERITPSKLVKWVAIAGDYCKNFPSNKTVRLDPVDFLHYIGWGVLPQLIDCETSDDRILTLKERLVWLFGCEGYSDSKTALLEIGRAFSKAIVKYDHDEEDVFEFMKIYNRFLRVVGMYGEIEFSSKNVEAAA